ncbi:MAG: HK97 family phage prohead protease, partial [Flavobacteriales bacterium]
YAALFDVADGARDTIRPGAFAATLAARTEPLPLCWQHRPEQRIGWVEQARGIGLSKAVAFQASGFGRDGHLVELAWSVPVESMLISSKQGPQGTVSIITAQDIPATDALERTDMFVLRRWDLMPTSWLDRRWFGLTQGARYGELPAGP